MKIFNKYINFSKLLIFLLVVAFFSILIFDGYIIIKLINMISNGMNLMYAGVVGTIVGTMSTFSSAVILFAVQGYFKKSAMENTAGYDSKTNTISEERIKQALHDFKDMNSADIDSK